MSSEVFVPKRPSISCPSCGKESYQRVAEDGESILLLGKGQRFNVRTGHIYWNCKFCGAEHSISLFKSDTDGIKKSYEPIVKTRSK